MLSRYDLFLKAVETGTFSETARTLGLPHTQIPIAESDCLRAVGDWLAESDQPSIDGLNVHIVSEATKAAGITVALSGQGGDELFCGYPSFVQVPLAVGATRFLHNLPNWVREATVAALTAGRSPIAEAKIREALGGPASACALSLQRRRLLSDRQLNELGLAAPLREVKTAISARLAR